MLTHCYVGFIKVTNVQNHHHQHQCIVDNGMEESSGFLLLLMEYEHRQFHFCASGSAVFFHFVAYTI